VPNLTERQKVDMIVRALEAELDADLFLGDTDYKVGHIKASRKGFGHELGRPDAVIWVELEVHVLGVKTFLKVPILVEAEDAGMSAAEDDFQLFFEREKLEIPMVVVGKPNAPKQRRQYDAQAHVKLTMHQIGLDRVTNA
jgi:hypothetical protein